MSYGTNSGIQYEDEAVLNFPEGIGFTQGETFSYVHFRIDTPKYRFGRYVGFPTSNDENEFYSAVRSLLEPFGFEHRGDNDYMHYDEHNNLHIHPDSLSGIIPAHLVRPIHEAIEMLPVDGVFRQRWTDVIKTFEQVTPEEVQTRIKIMTSDIEKNMLDAYKTTRKTKFIAARPWSEFLPKGLPMTFIGEKRGGLNSAASQFGPHHNLANGFIRMVLNGLMHKGLIVRKVVDGDEGVVTYYRTANKTEVRELGLKRTDAVIG